MTHHLNKKFHSGKSYNTPLKSSQMILLLLLLFFFSLSFLQFTLFTTYLSVYSLQLIALDPEQRISSLDELAKHPFVDDVDWDAVLQMKIKPAFVPPVSNQ